MSVTQSYKTIILSDDAHLHAILAVTGQLLADCAAKRAPGEEYDKFLAEQIAIGTETLNALNSLTVTAAAVPAPKTVYMDNMVGRLDGMPPAMFMTLCSELHFLRHVFAHGGKVDKSSQRMECLNDVLCYLESPK